MKLLLFIVTLATMAIAKSSTHVFTQRRPVTVFSQGFREIGRSDVLGIPIPVIIMVAVFIFV